ncbi:hypothetical protein LDVICp143 [lymphocystis disease virus-China]|uniref:Uncharacterized protein n=1 Tax=lymphocystis disease virus-China TaxID=256729 RepID=Q677W9_9VIRU|nr:hypothetical protein LDVICp143 [lymphocystis disease virus-China]AAU10988.1 hypothetical protein [lymphocystis disease virus-China]
MKSCYLTRLQILYLLVYIHEKQFFLIGRLNIVFYDIFYIYHFLLFLDNKKKDILNNLLLFDLILV